MGVQFENHQVNSVACTSSRSNIYTGQHTVNTKMFDNVDFPWQRNMSRTKIPTMGNLMREAGYYTAYKGKWHLSSGNNNKIKEGQKSLSLEEYGFSDHLGIGEQHGALGGHHHDWLTTASAEHWLRSQGEDCRSKGQPWLLAVNLVNPHDIMFFNSDTDDEVIQARESFMQTAKSPNHHKIYQTKHTEPLPKNWNQPIDEPGRPEAHRNYRDIYDIMVGKFPHDDEERIKRHQEYYFNCMQDVDSNLDHLLSTLEQLELFKKTIIIYTSDHGELGGRQPTENKTTSHLSLFILGTKPKVGGVVKLSHHISIFFQR